MLDHLKTKDLIHSEASEKLEVYSVGLIAL